MPKVLIYSITYNHARFVENTLNGFSMQETDFDFLCCIIDDCSTDNEQDVLKSYINKNCVSNTINITETSYAHIIKGQHSLNKNCYFVVILLKFNHYSRNLSHKKKEYISDVCSNTSIEYIAWCEGDDYWTDNYKLQKQVNALDSHPELDMCVHAHVEKDALSGVTIGMHSHGDDIKILSLIDMIMGEGGIVGTNTIVYRSYIDKQMPLFRKLMDYDYTMQIHGAIRGGVLYIPDYMSVYNVDVPGSFCNRMKQNEKFRIGYLDSKIKMLQQLDLDLEYKYHKYIAARILLSSVNIDNTVGLNLKYFFMYRKGYLFIPFKEKFKIIIRALFPTLLRRCS